MAKTAVTLDEKGLAPLKGEAVCVCGTLPERLSIEERTGSWPRERGDPAEDILRSLWPRPDETRELGRKLLFQS